MNEITIPYHLAIPTFLCIIGFIIILSYRILLFKRNNWIWICISIFLLVYFFIVANATYDDIYYQWDLNNYDIDKDGFFSEKETTENQKAAMQRLTNDVGRNFSFITGALIAGVISIIIYLLGLLKNGLSNQKIK
ncbi:MAG: hypothetical protein C0448_14340 [Sphingobacteriaceae bacterium]|nr:hypothetical protein [Sphingobacteriaceae bacterium]